MARARDETRCCWGYMNRGNQRVFSENKQYTQTVRRMKDQADVMLSLTLNVSRI